MRRKAKLGLAVFGQSQVTGQCDMFILEAVWLKHSDYCFAAFARSKIWAGVTVCQREADGGCFSVSVRLMHRLSALKLMFQVC